MNEIPEDIPAQQIIPGARYEIRVNGRLHQDVAIWFEDMTLTVDETTTRPQTIIQGGIRDQAALYGLISRIRDLGLTLLSVTRLDSLDNFGGK